MPDLNSVHLSYIVPVYNAASFVEAAITEIHSFLDNQEYTFELIAVDDGSKDRSYDILNELQNKLPKLKVITNQVNRGKGYAVKNGIINSSGSYIIFNDIDLAYPMSEVNKILSRIEQDSDIAIACRVLPESRFEISPAFFRYLYTRHAMGRLFNFIVRLFVTPGILDTQAGLKGFKRDVARILFSKQTLERFSFDVEVLYVAQKMKYIISQVPIKFRYFYEESTVMFFQDTLNMLMDLIKIRLNSFKGIYK